MNNVPAGSNGQTLSLSDLHHKFEAKLQGKAVGYAFVISYKDKFANGNSGGFCRLSQDAPERPMTVFEKYDIASVSKPITGSALVLALYHKDGIGLNSEMWHQLPAHWEMGPGIKGTAGKPGITYKELLTHTSGIKAHGPRTYTEVKEVIKAGIGSDKSYKYASTNFALMRLLVPAIAGYDITPLTGIPKAGAEAMEPTQAKEYADSFMHYCNHQLFEKAGLPYIECKNDSIQPPLFYDFSDQHVKGKHMGDQTLEVGSRAFVMNTTQMADYFRTLHYTEKIMPLHLSKRMADERLGYGRDETEAVLHNFYKSGGETVNGRGFSSLFMCFENGVQFAVMTTSHLTIKELAWEAFNEWYH